MSCEALCRLDVEFTVLLSRLAKQGLLDKEHEGRTARTTLFHAALDTGSLEVVALLLRAGANPALVVEGVAESRSPLARALHELRIAMAELVAKMNSPSAVSHEAVVRAASSVNLRFAMGSLLVASVARARGVEAVAAAAPGDDLAPALLPWCAWIFPLFLLPPPYSTRFSRPADLPPPRPWWPAFGFLPQLLPLLPTGPWGWLDCIKYAVDLSHSFVDPVAAAAAAMDFVRHGCMKRAGRALAARWIVTLARFALIWLPLWLTLVICALFGLPLYGAIYFAVTSPALFAALLLALLVAYWWCAVGHTATTARAPATFVAGAGIMRAAVQAMLVAGGSQPRPAWRRPSLHGCERLSHENLARPGLLHDAHPRTNSHESAEGAALQHNRATSRAAAHANDWWCCGRMRLSFIRSA